MRALLGFLSLVSVLPAHIGSGDSVQPRDTESVITSIAPALPDGVRVTIVGGDTFVRVESDGVRVEVHGYDDEQYLRISPEGIVEINESSVTAVLNGDRYGNVDVSKMNPDAEPTWRTISTDGVAMWHDHRSHWMSPKRPAAIDDSGKVLDWNIPLVVAGKQILVSGTLFVRDKASVGWWLVGIPALILALLLALTRRRIFLWLTAAAAIVGIVVGYLEFIGLPDGARITPVLMLFSVGAFIISGVGISASRRDGGHYIAVSMNAGAGATLVIVSWLCFSQVRAAYVPGLDAAWIARTTIPMLMAIGIVAMVDGITRIVKPQSSE